MIVLCRTDIFNHLPGANTNKYRRDSGVTLNWYQDIKDPHSSHLIALVNRKAAATETPDVGNVFTRFFPARFRLESGKWFDTIRYLLEYTRHTPRDLLQLLEYIKEACKSGDPSDLIPGRVIEAGVHNFCADYFVGELTNELYGLLSMEEIDLTKRLLRSLRRHRFYYHELERKVSGSVQYSKLPLASVASRLFDAGVLGNAVTASNEDRVRFKYRNPHEELDYDGQIVLHNALVNGFNVPRSLSGPV